MVGSYREDCLKWSCFLLEVVKDLGNGVWDHFNLGPWPDHFLFYQVGGMQIGAAALFDQRVPHQFENLLVKRTSSSTLPANLAQHAPVVALKAAVCSHGPDDECIFCKDYDAKCR